MKSLENELVHKHDQAIMNGRNMNIVNANLNKEAAHLSQQEDNLITSFVTENFDNILGPGVFFMVTIGYQYPELTPWIEDIMSKATDNFKNDQYVKDYYKKALENQQIMNGMRGAPAYSQPAQAPAQRHPGRTCCLAKLLCPAQRIGARIPASGPPRRRGDAANS